MTKPDDRTASEYDLLARHLDRGSVIELVARRTKLPEEIVRQVIEELQHPMVAEEVVRNVEDVERFLLTMDIRVHNAAVGFAQKAVEVIGQVRPPEGKGVNYTSHWTDAIEAAQNEIEAKFK